MPIALPHPALTPTRVAAAGLRGLGLVLVLCVLASSALAQGKGPGSKAGASGQVSSEDAQFARQQMAHDLFEKLGLSSGRILVMVPKQPKGTPVGGLAGYYRADPTDLSQADFGHGSHVAVLEKGEDGAIVTREALIVSSGGQLVVLDEGAGGLKRRAQSSPEAAGASAGGKPGAQRTQAEQPSAEAMAGSEQRRKKPGAPQAQAEQPSAEATAEREQRRKKFEERRARRSQRNPAGKMGTRGVSGPDQVALYVDAVADDQTVVVVAEEEATTGSWTAIEIQGEVPLDCYEASTSKTGSIYNLGLGTTCKEADDEEPHLKAEEGQVWVGTAPICEANSNSCPEIGMKRIAYDKWGEGAKCLVGDKALCGPREEGEAYSIWLGTAPFCAGTPESCTKQGLVYVRSSQTGPEHAHVCVSGEKVLCETPDEDDPKVQVWIGTAPFCAAKKSDCTERGMNYVKSSKTGDGKKCTSGEKVLCESK